MKEVKGFKTETRETRKKENEKPRQPREHPEGCGSRKPCSRNNNKERRLEANYTWKGYITLAPEH